MKNNTAVFLLLLLAVAVSWLPGQVCANGYRVLQGKVTDIFNQPVQGAELQVYNSENVKRPADFMSRQTDSHGAYQLNIPPGTYWAVAVLRKDGRKFGPLAIEDKHSGEPVMLKIDTLNEYTKNFVVYNLREAAQRYNKKNDSLIKVTGKILNSSGEPVAMAYALADSRKIISEIPQYLSAWTQRSGEFTLFLPSGKFFLGASKAFPPDSPYSMRTEIDTEQTTQVDIVIKQK